MERFEKICVVFVEVKSAYSEFNDAWTDSKKANLERFLEIAGVFKEKGDVHNVAKTLYECGYCETSNYEFFLVLIANQIDPQSKLPQKAIRLTYKEAASFIYDRFKMNHDPKTDVGNWDAIGRKLQALGSRSPSGQDFWNNVCKRFNVKG